MKDLFRKPPPVTRVEIPSGYARKLRWQPQLFDIVPNAFAESTHGPIALHPYCEGKWTILFSHPAAYTPVCSTEIAAMAVLKPDFDALGVQLLGLCQSSVEEIGAWHRDLEQVFGIDVDIPCIADADGAVAAEFGMIHDKAEMPLPVRKTMIIDPGLRLRLITEYPIFVARGTEELLRSVEALQLVDRYGVGTGADWAPKDDVLLDPRQSDAQHTRRFGTAWRKVRPYLSTAPDPVTAMVEGTHFLPETLADQMT